MRFKGLDLNLLVALDTLLDARSVSAAARRMHLSQSAMSGALARLREYFGDDLLVCVGKRMFPTAYAEGLVPLLKVCLQDVQSLVENSADFDPATAQRCFVLVASDYITVAVLVPLVKALSTRAPGIRFNILAPGADSNTRLQEGQVDLIFTPDGYAHPDHPVELLFEEAHVVAGCRTNPIFERPITESNLLAAGHVAVSFSGNMLAAFADRQLALMGKERRIEITAASFTSVPWLLVDTRRLALMHERLAETMAERFAIAYAPLPFEIPVMKEVMQYHAARKHDVGLRWLRQELANAAKIDRRSR